MKKILCMLLAILMLIACCGCGAQNAVEESATEATIIETAPAETQPEGLDFSSVTNKEEEDPFANINEFEPDEEGIYNIYTVEGLMNVYNHLDGSFILLQDLDLGGIDWKPVGSEAAPFTGKFNGNNHTLSNFTITENTAEGDMGMFGVNAGNVVNVYTENVTMTTNKDTKRAGLLVAYNQGKIRRGNVAGAINAEALAQDAMVGGLVGYSIELMETTTADVDLNVTADVKAAVGGIVGHQEGNIIRSCIAAGKFEITGGDQKSAGLFAGVANDAELTECQFLGEANKVDGQLFMECIGAQTEATTNIDYALRDNSREKVEFPADVQARRDKVVATARAMAGTYWTVKEPIALDYNCTCCKDRTLMPGKTYRGIPYTHKNGSMQRFLYCMEAEPDEQGRLVLSDWVYDYQGTIDTWDIYVGNDCSSFAQQCYAVVSDEVQFYRSRTQFPNYGFGTIAVGDWVWDIGVQPDGYVDSTIKEFIEPTGVEQMYECYAQARAGDMLGNTIPAGGHCRIVVEDPVVMLDAEGNMDYENSYFITCEQTAFTDFENEDGSTYTSSCRYDTKYTFAELMKDGYVPMTVECLVTSTTDVSEATVEDTVDGRLGLTTGIVTATRNLDSVEMVITDDAGNEILRQRMFVTAGKTTDSNSEYLVIRKVPKTYDLANFTAAVSQIDWDLSKTYHCTITALLTCGDEVVAREFDF